MIVAGLGLAAVGFIGRQLLKNAPGMSQKFSEAMKSIPGIDSVSRCIGGTNLFYIVQVLS